MFECELYINGIDDEEISSYLDKALDFFEAKGYELADQYTFRNNGTVAIEGEGDDGRCRCCGYLRKMLESNIISNQTSGSIRFKDCPYNKDKQLDYTPDGN
jgi:hypothetical protein